jgi:hypothetical protein
MDYTAVLFGEHARHVPAWLYVQDQGQGIVSLVGASRLTEPANPIHPLRFGSNRPHQFILGEVIVRPHLVIATSALRGSGLSGLATDGPDVARMLADGEVLIGNKAMLRRATT